MGSDWNIAMTAPKNPSIWIHSAVGFLMVMIATSFQPLLAQQAQALAVSSHSAKLTATKAREFHDALQSLADQTGSVFVVENTPLHPVLTADAASLLATDSMPLNELIIKVALAYDYDVQEKNQIFILRKRYTNLQDLPGLTLPECFQSLQAIGAITDRFNPHIPEGGFDTPDLLATKFVSSLSASQLQLLNQKKLPIQSLNQLQAFNVQRIVRYVYVQNPTRGISGPILMLANPSEVVFCWHDYNGRRVFGYELTSKPTASAIFYPLSYEHTTQNDKTSNELASVTKSTPTSTLGEEISALNNRKELGKPIDIDPILSDKPIIIVGNTTGKGNVLLDAFATTYALRIVASDNGNLRLTTVPVHSPITIEALSKAVCSALPEPLLRALHSNELDEMESQELESSSKHGQIQTVNANPKVTGTSSKLPDTNVTPNLSEQQLFLLRQVHLDEKHKKFEKLIQLTRRAHDLEENAAQQLVSLVIPKMLSADSRVALSSLETEPKSAFANMVMAQSIENMEKLIRRTPPRYITDIDKLTIGGGFGTSEAGRPYVNVSLYLPSSNGSDILEQCGFTRFLKP